MSVVHIVRQKTPTNTVARKAVKPGQIFQSVNKDGTVGSKAYIDVGNNGKHLSVNAASGELSSSQNGDKKVVIVGSAKFKVTRATAGTEKATTRGQVKVGDVFRVKGGKHLYAHMGTLNDPTRFASLNLEDPFNDNYATTENGRSAVEVVGTWELEGIMV